MKRTTMSALLSILLASTALAGCSLSTEPQTREPQGGDESLSVDEASSDAPSADATGTSPDVDGTVPAALMTRTFDAPPSSSQALGGTMTTTLTAVEVSGETMTLRWTFRWDDDGTADDEIVMLNDFGLSYAFLPVLTDTANLKQYRALCTNGTWKDVIDSIKCRASQVMSPASGVFSFTNHTAVEAWAILPAPQDAPPTIHVSLVDGWPDFAAVPVTYLDK